MADVLARPGLDCGTQSCPLIVERGPCGHLFSRGHRELQVLRLLVEGCSNRALATRLAISENTAANHVRSILAKTGTENRTQAVVYATDQGLTD